MADSSGPRVGVFFDWQNSLRCAREAFGPGSTGMVNPLLMGKLLAGRREDGQAKGKLEFVRIHAGMASQRRDPRTYAANRRQFQHWQNLSPQVHVINRTVSYSSGQAHEKGIDVALAIDLVRCVLFESHCDIAVLCSCDTDLLPALELVAERRPGAIEVAAWSGPNPSPAALSIKGSRIRQHLLDATFYRKVEDRTDYNIPRR